MSFSNWTTQPEVIFAAAAPVIPVLVIKNLKQAIPLAEALLQGGIKVLEITLRTPVAIEAIELLINEFPEVLIGAGTVTTPAQLAEVAKVGAKFAISPGQTQDLLRAGRDSSIPLIPGIASVSELMAGLSLGYTHFKLFPATVVGGIPMLRALFGPFPEARFCPTGGVNEQNATEYLTLPNVSCVGGSWIVPPDAVKNGDWARITDLCLALQKIKE